MKVRVLFFGMIAEALESSVYSIENYGGNTIGELEADLLARYPLLGEFTYQIALNQKTVDKSETLKTENEIAILPPFAGG